MVPKCHLFLLFRGWNSQIFDLKSPCLTNLERLLVSSVINQSKACLFGINVHRSVFHLNKLNIYLKSVEMSLKDQSSWFNPVAVALDVRPKRVFQPVWTRDAFRMEFCGIIQLLLSISNRRCISNSLYFHKITNVNSSETLDWHLQHINYALILWNEEMANAEICDRVVVLWWPALKDSALGYYGDWLVLCLQGSGWLSWLT